MHASKTAKAVSAIAAHDLQSVDHLGRLINLDAGASALNNQATPSPEPKAAGLSSRLKANISSLAYPIHDGGEQLGWIVASCALNEAWVCGDASGSASKNMLEAVSHLIRARWLP